MKKAYKQRFNLRNIFVVVELLKRTLKAHEALQNIEAPEKVFKTVGQFQEGIAAATFTFLYALGYYPDNVIVSGQTFKVKEWSHRKSLASDTFFAVAHLENGGQYTVDLLGPDNPNGTVLGVDDVLKIISAFFPDLIVQTTTGISNDGEAVFHVSVREQFIQESYQLGSPVPNGSAMNRESIIAIMQATIRMTNELLLDAAAAAAVRHLPNDMKDKLARIANWKSK